MEFEAVTQMVWGQVLGLGRIVIGGARILALGGWKGGRD